MLCIFVLQEFVSRQFILSEMFAEYLKCFQRFPLLNSDSKVRLGVYKGRIPWFSTRKKIGSCDVYVCENISCHIDKFSTFIIWCVSNAISFNKSVCLKQCDSHRTDFRGIYYLGLSTKICSTSIVAKSGKNKKYLHEDLQILEKNLMIRTRHSSIIQGKSRSLRYRYKNDITPFPRCLL